METQSQTSSAAQKKKRVETIVATKSASTRADISEKAVASSTTSNGLVGSIPTWLDKDWRRPAKHSSVDRLPWPDSSKEPTVPPQWPDWSSLEGVKGMGLPSSSTHIIC
ncbi:hypothetical protein PO909_016890 [Leuciscus waleckii]